MLGTAKAAAIVPVSDRERGKEFYGGTLGLRLLEETGADLVYEAGGGTLLSLYETPHAGKAAHTLAAFLVEDLDATLRDLRAAGVTIEDYDLPGLKTVDGVAELDGERGAWFKDPDGNILAVGQRTG